MNKYEIYTKTGGSRNFEIIRADSFEVSQTGLVSFFRDGKAIYWTSIYNLVEIILKQ